MLVVMLIKRIVLKELLTRYNNILFQQLKRKIISNNINGSAYRIIIL